MVKIILLIGAPGSGKGSLGKMCEKHGHIHISSSRLLTQAGYDMKHSRDIPDEVVVGLIQKVISAGHNNSTVILDGFPRNMNQVKALEQEIEVTKAIYLKISKGIALQRVMQRLVCPVCGEIYNTDGNKQPKIEEICDICGGLLEKRHSDDKKTFQKRLAYFARNTYPVIKYFGETGKTITLDATKVNEETITMIDSL